MSKFVAPKNHTYLTIGMNRDGSSTFGKGNRFSNFPRASFSWKPYDQYKNPAVNKIVFRWAWGKAGSDPDAYLTKNAFFLISFSEGWGP